jgi:hypothetical protein
MVDKKQATKATTSQGEEKVVLGLIEEITLFDVNGKEKKLLAKIDTGANISSIDMSLATELSLGPIIRTKTVVSSHGRSLRPVVAIDIDLAGKTIDGNFTLYNRSHMTFKVLIGRDVLRRGFLIDPSKNEFDGYNKADVLNFESDTSDVESSEEEKNDN